MEKTIHRDEKDGRDNQDIFIFKIGTCIVLLFPFRNARIY